MPLTDVVCMCNHIIIATADKSNDNNDNNDRKYFTDEWLQQNFTVEAF